MLDTKPAINGKRKMNSAAFQGPSLCCVAVHIANCCKEKDVAMKQRDSEKFLTLSELDFHNAYLE